MLIHTPCRILTRLSCQAWIFCSLHTASRTDCHLLLSQLRRLENSIKFSCSAKCIAIGICRQCTPHEQKTMDIVKNNESEVLCDKIRSLNCGPVDHNRSVEAYAAHNRGIQNCSGLNRGTPVITENKMDHNSKGEDPNHKSYKQNQIRSNEAPQNNTRRSRKRKKQFKSDSYTVTKKSVLPKGLLQQVTDSVREQMGKSSSYPQSVMSTAVTRFRVEFERELSWISHRPERVIPNTYVTPSLESSNITQDYAILPTRSIALSPRNKTMNIIDNYKNNSKEASNMNSAVAIDRMDVDGSDIIEIGGLKSEYNDSSAENVEELIADKGEVTLEDSDMDRMLDSSVPEECDISLLFTEKFDAEYKKIMEARPVPEEQKSENKQNNRAKLKKEKPKRPTPNYFVSVQISNPEIQGLLKIVQDSILNAEPHLKPAMNPIATLHITLFVMYLETEEDMQRAREALENCVRDVNPLLSGMPLDLDITGIGNFNDQVVFAQIKPGIQLDRLHKIADQVQQSFKEAQIPSADKKGFKPHITFMKLSRAGGRLWKKGVKKIDSSLYKNFKDTHFGVQNVGGLQVCAMLKPKASNGYYQLLHHVRFASTTAYDSDGDTASTICEDIVLSCVNEATQDVSKICLGIVEECIDNAIHDVHSISLTIIEGIIDDAVTKGHVCVSEEEEVVPKTLVRNECLETNKMEVDDKFQDSVSNICPDINRNAVEKTIRHQQCVEKTSTLEGNLMEAHDILNTEVGTQVTAKDSNADTIDQMESTVHIKDQNVLCCNEAVVSEKCLMDTDT